MSSPGVSPSTDEPKAITTSTSNVFSTPAPKSDTKIFSKPNTKPTPASELLANNTLDQKRGNKSDAADLAKRFLDLPGLTMKEKVGTLLDDLHGDMETHRDKAREIMLKVVTSFVSPQLLINEISSAIARIPIEEFAMESRMDILRAQPMMRREAANKPQYQRVDRRRFESGMIGMMPLSQLMQDPQNTQVLRTAIADFCVKEYPIVIKEVHENVAKGLLLTSSDSNGLKYKDDVYRSRSVSVIPKDGEPGRLYNSFDPLEVAEGGEFVPREGCHIDLFHEIDVPLTRAFRPVGCLDPRSEGQMCEYSTLVMLRENMRANPYYAGILQRVFPRAVADAGEDNQLATRPSPKLKSERGVSLMSRVTGGLMSGIEVYNQSINNYGGYSVANSGSGKRSRGRRGPSGRTVKRSRQD